jgi:hypothetical protein
MRHFSVFLEKESGDRDIDAEVASLSTSPPRNLFCPRGDFTIFFLPFKGHREMDAVSKAKLLF